jgi:hypothetical protein
MLYLPPDPKPHQPIRAFTITAILKYLRSITPRTSTWCDVQVGPGGATFRPKFPRAGAGSSITGTGTPALFVYDASDGDTPKISVTPGAISQQFVPLIGSAPINLQTGIPLAWPALTVSDGDTLAYFTINYNASNVITTVTINSGTSLPAQDPSPIVPGTAGVDYKGLSTISVKTLTSGNVYVNCLNDFITGPFSYAQCGGGSQTAKL